MNERIKELAEQAGILSKPRQLGPAPVIQPGVLNPLRKYVSDEEYIQDNFDVIRAVLGGNGLEKFAELIVRECAEAGNLAVVRGIDEMAITRTALPNYVEYKIKQHFGIDHDPQSN